MEKLAVGLLAHVDAGKTTLSEGLLYACEITLPGAGDYIWGQVYLEFV